ncbi:MAG: hypothetical protein K9G38_00455 [Bacteroidales bacterium]|nr:hypothetical protein [Bacteroidales bacterium]
MKTKLIIILLSLVLIILSGCDTKDGDLLTDLELPTDYILNLYSQNEGIHPDTSVLDDPENPYADAAIGMENVWDLSDECPSAKSKFYLWATILANIPIGEYQYFTAKSLHELYTTGGSENAKAQAKKAYRATLDHFFDSATWWQAEWLTEETYYAVLLRNLTAQSLYNPSNMNLMPLYNDPVQALADMSEWGYVYDPVTGIVSKRI